MPLFFATRENICDDNICITNKADIQHITGVLRLKKASELIITGEDGFIYNTKILEINEDNIQTKVIDKSISNKKLNINITLAQSILKAAKQDLVIQKATELGANAIIPLTTKNTVVKFENDKDKYQKISRWEKICYETIKQCERADFPSIKPVMGLKETLSLTGFDTKIACVERSTDITLKQALKYTPSAKNILLLIGPEGGWTDDEISLLKKENVQCASLGNMILRAETAAITAISGAIYEYEL